nr:MAG TPA: hypothetical protein [Microviridae sp.]
MEHKNLKIMAATNWTIVTRRKDNGIVVTFPLLSKWTYKTAVAIAKESTDTSTFEIICIVETNKILLNNDKKEIQTDELPIG